MEVQDGQVPAPRRAGPPARPPAPPNAGAPRVADLSALLADIDALRTTLSTDLSLAAAALEAGADDLAGELVAADLAALRTFEASSLAHLASLETPVGPGDPVEPVIVLHRRRRMLPAAPLVAAAAAVIGLFAGVVPGGSPPWAPSTTAVDGWSQAGYSLAMLSEMADQGADPDDLRKAASDLNENLARLVADAGNDPGAARQALLLLQGAAQVLAGQSNQGPLREVLARTRELELTLRSILPLPVSAVVPTVPSRPGLLLPRPELPRPAARPSRAVQSAQRAGPGPAGKAAASPAPAPSPPAPSQPASAAAPTSAPTTAPSPSPSSSPSDVEPLPGASALTGALSTGP